MASTATTTMPAAAVCNHHAMTLDDVLRIRHSSRRFLPTPVPKDILHTALQLATYAPSNSNIQPWRLYILSGAALERLKAALSATAEASTAFPYTPLPEGYQRFRSELGMSVYSDGLGIARSDHAGRRRMQLRNFDFFGAPVAAIVCRDHDLVDADTMAVGMYLQSFLLGLAEDSVSSCVEVSVAGFPEVIREVAGIPENLDILCGVAIGYEDPAERVNQIRATKRNVEETTVMLEE